MGSVAKKFDKSWNLVTFSKDRNGSMESQLFIEVTDQSNFDDILSNTSSDESECYSKPQTADSNGGCDLEDTEDGGEFGQNTLTEVQEDEADEVPTNSVLGKFLSSIRIAASNLRTWEVMVLTSSTTIIVYYIVQQLWYRFGLRQHDYRSEVSNIVVDVPGSVKDTQVVFDNMELAAPFEVFGTKKFLVDFEKKVAYPISSPEDIVLTEVGKHVVSRLVGYQLNLLYRFHYQYLPEVAHRYKVFKDHISHGFGSASGMFGFTTFPNCMSSLKSVGTAGDGVVDFMMKYFRLTRKVVEGSYDEVVHAFNVLADGWERTIMPLPRNSVQFLAHKTYIIMQTFSAVNWHSIDRWFSKKWFLVSKQACKYFRIFKFSFAGK